MLRNNIAFFVNSVRRHIFLDLLVIVCISLTPFFWLRDGSVILGHDAGLPVEPSVHFEDRLYTWTDRYAAGSDQTFALAGFFLHGYEAVLDTLSFPLSTQQSIQFSTYIFLSGISMYILMRRMFPESSDSAALFASVFYQCNHFVLQAWFIAERTKFSLYVSLPIIILILFELLYKKRPPVLMGVVAACFLTVFNGGGFLPLYASLGVSGAVFVSMSVLLQRNKLQSLKKFLVFLGVFLLSFIALNAYWLFPYFIYVQRAYLTEVSAAGGFAGIVGWVKSISENTSYLNLLRLQGIQEWYVNPEHPYARFYTRFSFVTFSFLFPLVLMRVFFIDKRTQQYRLLLVLSLIAVLSIFFMAGSHDPFGFIYLFLIKHVPGFIAFRTPYYKFANGYYFAFAIVFSLLLATFLQKFDKKRVLFWGLKLFMLSIILLYNFPFFSVDFFQYTSKLSTRVQLPEYVQEYAQFAQTDQFPASRVLLLPGPHPEKGVYLYDWGYWSLASLGSLSDRLPYVTLSEGSGLDASLRKQLYFALYQNDPDWVEIARFLGIDGILVQQDAVEYSYQGQSWSVDTLKKNLESNANVTKVRQFDQWSFYSLSESQQFTMGKDYVELQYLTNDRSGAEFLTSFFDLNTVVFSNTKLNTPVAKRLGTVIIPTCQDCLLERLQTYIANPNIILAPDSPLFKLKELNPFSSTLVLSLETAPVESFQNLYVLLGLFERKAPKEVRMIVWQKIVNDLESYEIHLLEFLKSDKVSYQENTKLQSIYNNLIAQKSLLRDFSNTVNDQSEAELFFESQKIVDRLVDTTLEALTTTEEIHQDTYFVDLTESGKYDVYLDVSSLNSSESATVPIQIDNQPVINGVPIQLAGKTSWSKLHSTYLEKGPHEFKISNSFFSDSSSVSVYSDPAESKMFEYADTALCAEIVLGTLEAGRYSVTLELQSIEGDASPFLQVRSPETTVPKLQYWSNVVKLSSEVWEKSILPFRAESESTYTLNICDPASKEVRKLNVRSLQVDRYVEPMIALYKPDETVSTASSYRNVNVNKQSNTNFSMSNLGTEGILKSNLNLNAQWTVNPSVKSTFTQLNGNKNGWIIEENTSNEITLTYQQEKYHKIGIFVSLGYAGVIILFLSHYLFKYATRR